MALYKQDIIGGLHLSTVHPNWWSSNSYPAHIQLSDIPHPDIPVTDNRPRYNIGSVPRKRPRHSCYNPLHNNHPGHFRGVRKTELRRKFHPPMCQVHSLYCSLVSDLRDNHWYNPPNNSESSHRCHNYHHHKTSNPLHQSSVPHN